MLTLGHESKDLHQVFQPFLGASFWRGRTKYLHHGYHVKTLLPALFSVFFSCILSLYLLSKKKKNPHTMKHFSTIWERSVIFHGAGPSLVTAPQSIFHMLQQRPAHQWSFSALPQLCLAYSSLRKENLPPSSPYSTGLFTLSVWHDLDWIKPLCNHISNWLTPLRAPMPGTLQTIHRPVSSSPDSRKVILKVK